MQKDDKYMCYRCYFVYSKNEAATTKHKRLKGVLIPCCPKCGCWWTFNTKFK